MSGFLAGAAAGYRGYSEESRRIADEERRVKQDARMDQDATFQEEMRGRQRTDWQDMDAEKVAVANDRAALQKERQSSEDDFLSKITDTPKAAEQPTESKTIAQTFAPVAKQVIVDPNAEQATSMPVVGGLAVKKSPIQLNQQIDLSNSAPVESQNVAANAASIPQAGGMIQKPRNFNSTLDDELSLLQKKVSRGKASVQDYANAQKMVNQIKSEGVHEALNLMSSGDYEGAMDKFNSVGIRKGATIIAGREGVTLIDGDQVPTHFVTIKNADGTRTEIDVTKARYQLMDFDKQLASKDRAATRQMNADYHKGQLNIAQQKANTQEQYRKDQAENMRQQRALQMEEINARKQAALKEAQTAPIWNDKASAYLQDTYSVKDPATGTVRQDGDGLAFAKIVATEYSKKTGGNIDVALGRAVDKDNMLRQIATDPNGTVDYAKLKKLRSDALSTLFAPATTANQNPVQSAPTAVVSAQGTTVQNKKPEAVQPKPLPPLASEYQGQSLTSKLGTQIGGLYQGAKDVRNAIRDDAKQDRDKRMYNGLKSMIDGKWELSEEQKKEAIRLGLLR